MGILVGVFALALAMKMLYQFVKQQVENPAIFHFPTLATPTMSAWNIMEMIGAGLTLAGEFALTPAMRIQFVRLQVEKLAISHFPTLATPTMSAWNIMEMIGAGLTLDGEFALTPAINT